MNKSPIKTCSPHIKSTPISTYKKEPYSSTEGSFIDKSNNKVILVMSPLKDEQKQHRINSQKKTYEMVPEKNPTYINLDTRKELRKKNFKQKECFDGRKNNDNRFVVNEKYMEYFGTKRGSLSKPILRKNSQKPAKSNDYKSQMFSNSSLSVKKKFGKNYSTISKMKKSSVNKNKMKNNSSNSSLSSKLSLSLNKQKRKSNPLCSKHKKEKMILKRNISDEEEKKLKILKFQNRLDSKKEIFPNNYGLFDKKKVKNRNALPETQKFQMENKLPPSPPKRLRLFASNQKKPSFRTVNLSVVGKNNNLALILIKKLFLKDQQKVFLCLNPETSTIYCLKSNIVEKNKLKSLIFQFKIGSQISHPNLVKTYCLLYDQNNLYLMMEYLEGGNLAHLLRLKNKEIFQKLQINEKDAFPATQQLSKINWIREVLKQILQGLRCLHQNGIIHRGLKPDNIFITHGTYKIGDFGCSSVDITQQHAEVTIEYTSPEVLQKKDYNQSIDLWAIGCIAFQLDQRKSPFFHVDRNEKIHKIVNIIYDSTSISDPELRDFIQKLLVKHGNLRLTAEQALQHPFLMKYSQKIDKKREQID